MQRAQGFANVTFNGVPPAGELCDCGRRLSQTKVALSLYVALEVIEAPVTAAFWNASMVAIGIMLLMGVTVWLMLLPFRRQLAKLLDAMEDIAER